MTVMDKLRKKGWARRQADGRPYRYEPLVYGASVTPQALAASRDQPAGSSRA